MAPEHLLMTKRAVVPRVRFDFTAFAVGEAEAITGATGSYQKELRRRGILINTEQGRQQRYDLFGLGPLMVMRLLSDRGGPGLARYVAKSAGFGIAWYALAYYDAYSGDRDRILAWDPALFPRIEAFQAATALIRGKNDWPEDEARAEVARVAGTLDGFNGWMAQADWMRTEIFRLRQCDDVPVPRFLCWWPTGKYAWQPSLDAAFSDAAPDDPRLLGPVVVLDMARLGMQLVHRMKQATGKAFVTVQVGVP